MNPFETEFFALIDKAEAQNYGPDTAPWLDEAYKLAEDAAKMQHALLARYLYTYAIAPVAPHKAIVTFTWCLGNEEHCGPLIPRTALTELFGIVSGIIRSYPDYSLEQIEATFKQMESRYEELGLPMRDVLHHRLYGKLGTGDREGARAIYQKWLGEDPSPRGCAACDRATRVLYHIYLDEDEQALELADSVLAGELTCNDGQPMITQCAVLVPLLRRNRFEEAENLWRASTNYTGEVAFAGIWSAGRRLFYLSLVGNVDAAMYNFEANFPASVSRGTPTDRFGFFLAARVFALRLRDQNVKADLSKPLSKVDGLELDNLHAWLDDEVQTLATAFNDRNRNKEFSRIASEYDRLYREVGRSILPPVK